MNIRAVISFHRARAATPKDSTAKHTAAPAPSVETGVATPILLPFRADDRLDRVNTLRNHITRAEGAGAISAKFATRLRSLADQAEARIRQTCQVIPTPARKSAFELWLDQRSAR